MLAATLGHCYSVMELDGGNLAHSITSQSMMYETTSRVEGILCEFSMLYLFLYVDSKSRRLR
jgi:hypothetical protein